jgi:crotonobetainyl-CoA:carnitine CoA-transferase CaiB-like acyl-CoA transferase
LSDLGAVIIKVEPVGGDPMQSYCPSWYEELSRNQQVLRLNLKEPKDAKRFRRVLSRTDVLLTSQRKAALKRLALTWKELHSKFPRLSQVAIVGHAGADGEQPGHDLTYLAMAGLAGPPSLPKTLFVDIAAAERAVSSTLGLLLQRRISGKAGYHEVVMADIAADFAAPLRHGLTIPGGILGGGLPEYNYYRASDGWIAVAALEARFSARLKEKLRYRQESELRAIFRGRKAQEWERWGRAHDLPVVAVRSQN